MSEPAMQTTVILNDTQIPYQDQAVLDLVLEFIDVLKPNRVILNGDIADCYSISDFNKDPMSKATLTQEIAETEQLMDRLKDINEKVFIGGNHEDRLRRFIWKHAPQFDGILDFPNLFNLERYGFSWLPYGKYFLLGKLLITHGDLVRQQSGATARAHLEKFGKSSLVGHTHRLGTYFHTRLGKPYVAYENGCLCDLNPEYINNPNWQHGFAVVHHDPTSGTFNVQQLPIFKVKGEPRFFWGQEVIVA